MRARFVGVIEDATHRRVIGFMSGNQQNPDIMCEVFILAPTDLVDVSPGPRREPPGRRDPFGSCFHFHRHGRDCAHERRAAGSD